MNPIAYANRPLDYEPSEHSELLYPAVPVTRIELVIRGYESRVIPLHHTGMTPKGLFGLRLNPHMVDFRRIIVSLRIQTVPRLSTAPNTLGVSILTRYAYSADFTS